MFDGDSGTLDARKCNVTANMPDSSSMVVEERCQSLQLHLTSKILLSTILPPSSSAPRPARDVAAVGPSICGKRQQQH